MEPTQTARPADPAPPEPAAAPRDVGWWSAVRTATVTWALVVVTAVTGVGLVYLAVQGFQLLAGRSR